MRYDEPLSHEATRGTKTYYFPRNRHAKKGAEAIRPEVTLMVRRDHDGSFRAGISVCSLGDMFRRREGRARAFENLLYAGLRRNGFLAQTPEDLFKQIADALNRINERHPFTLSFDTGVDLQEVIDSLPAAFDKLDANRAEKDAAAA